MNALPPLAQSPPQGIPIALALLISAALHLAIIFAVQVGNVEQGGRPRRTIEAHLAPWPAVGSVEVLVKAIDGPVKSLVQDYQPPPQASVGATPAAADEAPPVPGIPEAAASPVLLDAPLPVDETYYGLKEVDAAPSKLGDPVYPEQAARLNISGKVRVRLLLNENGSVDEATILAVDPSGWGFDEAVLEYLKSGRFKPAIRKGRAVRSTVDYELEFSVASQRRVLN